MIYSAKDLEGYAIAATNGPIGTVKDFFFDDQSWVIRYLVVDTGTWLASREVLVSPLSLGQADRDARTLTANITKEQVQNSPDVDTRKPVTRQQEEAYLGYYGYPSYWGGAGLWGDAMLPSMMLPGYEGFGSPDAARAQADAAYARVKSLRRDDDPHLRSFNAVRGYHLEALDGEIGHLEGMLVDDENWAIRYLIVDTSNWWFGHKVLVAPAWIRDIRWEDSKVSVDLTQQALKDAPAYDPDIAVDRLHEVALHRHHGRSGYWPGQEDAEMDVETRAGAL